MNNPNRSVPDDFFYRWYDSCPCALLMIYLKYDHEQFKNRVYNIPIEIVFIRERNRVIDMGIPDILNAIVIQPLIFVFDVLYNVLYGLFEEPVLSVIALSIVINMIVLPLYKRADSIQSEEQKKQRKMKRGVEHIRKCFSGDERFMILAEYYKIEHYNPLYSLREALPLLLQIPFFIAAYQYISNMAVLETASFGPITNLKAPDGLLKLGTYSINVLPLLMTAINCASGYIYTKGGTLRQKLQIYSIAAVFLALLYNSPSGLVIYWIANQVFSLGKNYLNSKEAINRKTLKVFLAIVLIFLIILGFAQSRIDTETDILFSECLLLWSFVQLVKMIVTLKKIDLPLPFRSFLKTKEDACFRDDPRLLLSIEACLALLMGVFIPSTVLSSSVSDFYELNSGTFQSKLLLFPALLYAGLFLLWSTALILSGDAIRKRTHTAVLCAFLGIALVNQFQFDPHVGVLYSDLVFDGQLRFSALMHVLNIGTSFLAALVCFRLVLEHPKAMKSAAMLIAAALLCVSVRNIWLIHTETKLIDAKQVEHTTHEGTIHFSKNGRNVIVIMLDRAIGAYAPYIFDEKPEYKASFKGFTFYPNTVSFGPYTNFGSPGLFGGYEYTPKEMDKRSHLKLKDKHDEALKLMPLLFSENGYHVTVCDPPYAGYKDIPDLSIYDDCPEVEARNLSGLFTATFNAKMDGSVKKRQLNNFLSYSVFRIVPLSLKPFVYNNGRYLNNLSNTSINPTFLNQYAVLAFLPEITEVRDDKEQYCLMLQNSATHDPIKLLPPDYDVTAPSTEKDFIYSDYTLSEKTMHIRSGTDWAHYSTNLAVYREIAAFLDYLRDCGAYDNTRIIITADHGRDLGQFDELIHPEGLDIESLNPLLLVKDFDSNGPMTTSMVFMTNADTPSLAMAGIVDNPVNPFTGNPVDDSLKRSGKVTVTDSQNWQISKNNGYAFDLEKGHWWTVHDNIFKMNNWERIEDH